MKKLSKMAAAVEPVASDEVFEVEIENIGPVERATIPLVPGRVTVLEGTNGAGKSETIKALTALAVGGESLDLRDGAESGSISGLGITITVGRSGRNKRTGELEVLAVEDGFDLSKFVDPGLKDPAAADRQRIKTLATLLGIRVTKDKVKELVGDADLFKDNVTSKTLAFAATSAVEFVEGVKVDLQRGALEVEKAAAVAEQDALTLEGTIAGLDVDAVIDETAVNAALSKAVSELEALGQRQRDAAEATRIADEARRLIEGMEVESVTDIEAELELMRADVDEAAQRVANAESELRAATDAATVANNEYAEASRRLQSARAAAAKREEAKAKLVPAVVAPTVAEFDAAEAAVTKAREAVVNAANLKDARGTLAKAKDARDKSAKLAADAVRMRDAAASVNSLLSKPINDVACGVRVTDAGRLIIQGHRRGECFMSDLSPGEGWTIAMRLAATVFKSNGVPGLLAVPQECYEALDGHNLKLFKAAVKSSRLMVVTAKASPEDSEYIPVSGTVVE